MKSYTDLEQSKKLAEILPQESADMYYFLDPTPSGNIYHLTVQRVDVGIKNLPQYDEGDIPCWSLAALLDVMPSEVDDNHFLTIYKEGDEFCCCYDDINGNSFRHEFADNPIDACYEMLIKLHEKELL